MAAKSDMRGGPHMNCLDEFDLSTMPIPEPYNGKVSRVTFQGSGATVDVDLRDYTLGIFRDGHEVYYIDLERCLISSQLLDCIFQVAGKSWACLPLMGLIVKVLDAALYPQSTLCSCGSDLTIPASDIRKLIIARMRKAIAWQDSYQREGITLSWK